MESAAALSKCIGAGIVSSPAKLAPEGSKRRERGGFTKLSSGAAEPLLETDVKLGYVLSEHRGDHVVDFTAQQAPSSYPQANPLAFHQ